MLSNRTSLNCDVVNICIGLFKFNEINSLGNGKLQDVFHLVSRGFHVHYFNAIKLPYETTKMISLPNKTKLTKKDTLSTRFKNTYEI